MYVEKIALCRTISNFFHEVGLLSCYVLTIGFHFLLERSILFLMLEFYDGGYIT